MSQTETIIERIKREYGGQDLLDPEREEAERRNSLGAWARAVSLSGSAIGMTRRDEETLNI